MGVAMCIHKVRYFFAFLERRDNNPGKLGLGLYLTLQN